MRYENGEGLTQPIYTKYYFAPHIYPPTSSSSVLEVVPIPIYIILPT